MSTRMIATDDSPKPFRLGHFIGGRLVEGTSGRAGPVHDPATGALRGEVAYASAEETRAAIAAAEAALPGWSAVTPLQRARVMFRFKELLEEGHKIEIREFGTFRPVMRKEKLGRIIATGGTVKIPARLAPKFIPGRILKKIVMTGVVPPPSAATGEAQPL